MKEYIYRNHKTGQEIKMKEENQKWHMILYHAKGYKLHQVIDYGITENEKKAK